MDLVVTLALVVLATVFLVSAAVLVLMCRRRRLQSRYIKPSVQFKPLDNENFDVIQLGPRIAQVLDKNSWVYDVSGLLQHCVALLRLCHQLSEKLSAISLHQASPQLNMILCESTHRVMPRFDDLLASVASPHVDVRILEARATALTTVCWALVLPFTLLNPKYGEIVAEPLREMDTHLEVLRQAADLAERVEIGKVNVDWDRMADGGDPREQSAIQTEMTPLVDPRKLSPTITNQDIAASESAEYSHTANGNGHPVDPAV